MQLYSFCQAPPTILARQLHYLRLRRRQAIPQVSEAFGKQNTFRYKYETGERRIGLGTLATVLQTFRLSNHGLRWIVEAFAVDGGAGAETCPSL